LALDPTYIRIAPNHYRSELLPEARKNFNITGHWRDIFCPISLHYRHQALLFEILLLGSISQPCAAICCQDVYTTCHQLLNGACARPLVSPCVHQMLAAALQGGTPLALLLLLLLLLLLDL
jgi:hypothetical protein